MNTALSRNKGQRESDKTKPPHRDTRATRTPERDAHQAHAASLRPPEQDSRGKTRAARPE